MTFAPVTFAADQNEAKAVIAVDPKALPGTYTWRSNYRRRHCARVLISA